MLNVDELCVGNWVYDGDKTQFPMFIRAIGEDYVYLDFEGNEGDLWEIKPDDLNGIPLTPELIENIGYRHNGYGLWSKEEHRRKVCINIEMEFVAIEAFENRLCDSRCTCHGIKYLHQLQNLFYNIARRKLITKL